MIKITFRELLKNEIIKRELTNITADKAIENIKREYASSGVIFLEVEEVDQEIKKYFKQKNKNITEAKKKIDKAIKNIIKNPCTATDKKRSVKVNILAYIKKDISDYIYTLKNNNIVISFTDNNISIEATEQYYINF